MTFSVSKKQRKSPENGDWKILSTDWFVKNFLTKQRKSPENGDWKGTSGNAAENTTHVETKKISWKWRLKETTTCALKVNSFLETKKISWKWRLKGDSCEGSGARNCVRNKENLLKMEIERFLPVLPHLPFSPPPKQRKSPENGDWKRSLWTRLLISKSSGNKENLLKMEIERCISVAPEHPQEHRNKENLLKMEIESTA